MSLTAFDLALVEGCVIVESVSGQPLPLSVEAFADADEGNAFLAWALPERRAQLLEDPASLVRAWREQDEDSQDDETTPRDDAA